jgi:catechol-2,3-dioxygenase
MTSLQHVSAINLFVEDLHAARTFYREVFRVPVVFEAGSSAALRLGDLVVNLH